MIRTLTALRNVGLGLDPDHVLTLRVPLAGDRYEDPQAIAAFWSRVVESVAALPGVESVSVSRGVPIDDWAGQFFTIADRPNPPAGQVPDANYVVAGPDYFKALRIPLREGRTFDAHDSHSAEPVAIVSEELARRQWPGRKPGRETAADGISGTGPGPGCLWSEWSANVRTSGMDSGLRAIPN